MIKGSIEYLIRQASIEYGAKKCGAWTDNGMLCEGCGNYKKQLHLTRMICMESW